MVNKVGNMSNANMKKTQGRFQNLTPEERKLQGKKGGQKSVEVRKVKKNMQELARMIINSAPSKKVVSQINKVFPDLEIENITNATLLLSKVFEKAVNDKDIKAFEVLRDTAGYKPVDKSSITDAEGNTMEAPMIVINPVTPKSKKD